MSVRVGRLGDEPLGQGHGSFGFRVGARGPLDDVPQQLNLRQGPRRRPDRRRRPLPRRPPLRPSRHGRSGPRRHPAPPGSRARRDSPTPSRSPPSIPRPAASSARSGATTSPPIGSSATSPSSPTSAVPAPAAAGQRRAPRRRPLLVRRLDRLRHQGRSPRRPRLRPDPLHAIHPQRRHPQAHRPDAPARRSATPRPSASRSATATPGRPSPSPPSTPRPAPPRFRVDDWDDTRDVPYRLAYTLGIHRRLHDRSPLVRHHPPRPGRTARPNLADISCNTHAAFPNTDSVAQMARLDPDLLAFVGDQFYESTGGFGVVRRPSNQPSSITCASGIMHGWTWRELTRDRPSLSIPDDHDVYQGNIWGEAGARPANRHQESGGYQMDPAWVNVVHRTQTAHHPDPFDPTPRQARHQRLLRPPDLRPRQLRDPRRPPVQDRPRGRGPPAPAAAATTSSIPTSTRKPPTSPASTCSAIASSTSSATGSSTGAGPT